MITVTGRYDEKNVSDPVEYLNCSVFLSQHGVGERGGWS
jgi:hypothetical protein